jgi:hypothetical protein
MHGIGHGGLGTTAAPGTFPYFIYWLLFMLGRVSTNCIVRSAGYDIVEETKRLQEIYVSLIEKQSGHSIVMNKGE